MGDEETIDDVKQAYALLFKAHGELREERDALLDKVRDYGGRMTDEQYSTLAEYEDAIAGALFDFLGFLTTSERQWTFSSYDEASPAVEALEQWAKKRGLSLDEADVSGWRAALGSKGGQR